ncbi:MAG TPA: phosphoribosylamine--glycine ligase [Thermoanaerobaculia bacterium]
MPKTLLLCLGLVAGELPWSELSLTVDLETSVSSDHATLVRVRVVNRGFRTWQGRDLRFEVRALDGGVVVARQRGRFGLSLPPHGMLETLVGFHGRYARFEVVPVSSRGSDSKRRRRDSEGRSSACLTIDEMKVLVVGGGGREHALCSALRRSPAVREIYAAPGNPGIAEIADCVPVGAGDIVELADLAEKLRIDLTVVGPELALSLGIVDEFSKRQLPIFGPTRLAAQIETSKSFAKEFFRRHGIPTASGLTCSSAADAKRAIDHFKFPAVIKADGLAAGKGVFTVDSKQDAERTLRLFFEERVFGDAGDRVIVEEFLEGQEASFLAVCDGETASPLPTARDYKKVFDGERGPNTGGMGGHSPAGVLDSAASSRILKEIIWPTLRGLAAEHRPFRGVLYAGLMMTESGPKVLEFNARFGDPETQVILPRVKSDVAEVLLAATEGRLEEFPALEVLSEICVGVVLCSGGYPGHFEKGFPITGLGDAARVPGVQIFHAGTARRGERLVTAGGRILVVTAMAPSMSEAASRAYDAAEKIQFEGKHFRKDIGQTYRPSRV